MPSPSSAIGGGKSFQNVRQQLDHLGYYQPLVPESLSLVEALLHDLLKSRQDLTTCQDQAKRRRQDVEAPQSDKANKPKDGAAQSLQQDIDGKKVETLERKIFDLELLNAQAMSMVNRLQEESMEKSKKILKLESGINRAKVVTKSGEYLKPKIELSSLVLKPTAQKAGASASSQSGAPPPCRLDLLAMSEKKNKHLDQELGRLQKKLSEAQKMLASLDRELEKGQHVRSGGGSKSDSNSSGHSSDAAGRSAYMFKLIRENESLKEVLASFDRKNDGGHHRVLIRSNNLGGKFGGGARSCEDIRSAVEQSHMMMHNRCLKNQVGHLQHMTESLSHLDSHQKAKHIRAQQEHIAEIQDQLRNVTEENKELKRRVNELVEIRVKQKSKIDDLNKKQNILLKSGTSEYKKVEELIGYIEQQRDVYKNSVEKLLDKLDPNRNDREETMTKSGSKKDTVDTTSRNSSSSNDIQVLREIQNSSRRVLQSQTASKSVTISEEKSYRSSPYRNTSATLPGEQTSEFTDQSSEDREGVVAQHVRDEIKVLKAKVQEALAEKAETERRLMREVGSLREDNEKLKDEASLWKMRNKENERKLQENVGKTHDETDTAVLNLHDRLRAQQEALGNLESQLATKQRFLQKLSDDKDNLQNTLDDKTRELEEMRRRVAELSTQLPRLDADRVVGDQRMKQCLQEIQRLQSELADADAQGKNLRERQGAEKVVVTEMRLENNKLKDQLRTNEGEKRAYEQQVTDLKAHVQKYVNEIKRIEELFSAREKERSELLDQYKQLSLEIDTAESFGRKMQSQVESLQMQLAAREAELEASQRRLANLEKDLVELSLNNENFRAQVANLSTKVDVTTSQLREARSQTTWINTDLTNIHELAVQLNVQKVELQTQISDQSHEIETLNNEIRKLREEVSELSDQIKQEREKSRTLKERLEQERGGSPSQR